MHRVQGCVLEIIFQFLFGSVSHSETDQLVEQAKHTRHIFSDPLAAIVCPVLSLAIYLQNFFNTTHDADVLMFTGTGQNTRF
jgi:hypothetical protein